MIEYIMGLSNYISRRYDFLNEYIYSRREGGWAVSLKATCGKRVNSERPVR